jgi:glucan phosphorylase
MKLNRVLTHGLPSSSWGYPRESGEVAYFSMEIAIAPVIPTIGFARRAATYKRCDLVFTEPNRLQRLARELGGLQIIYSGKARPGRRSGEGEDPPGV